MLNAGLSVDTLAVYRRQPALWLDGQLDVLRQWAATHHNTGVWLITSAEGLAAIEEQYAACGFMGTSGFCPARVVVVHERLGQPVQRWLNHWLGRASEAPQVKVVAPEESAMLDGIEHTR
jgi:hypothetical protein